MTDKEVIDTFRMGEAQHWIGTERRFNPFTLGAKPDEIAAAVYLAGWRAAQREAQQVDRVLERIEGVT